MKQKDNLSAWTALKQIMNLSTDEMDERLMNTYNMCGNIMFELNRQNEAIDFYEKELRLLKQMNSERKKSERKSPSELIQILAIMHFGNQNLEQSTKYFELFAKQSSKNQNGKNDDLDEWLNDIKEAEIMLSA